MVLNEWKKEYFQKEEGRILLLSGFSGSGKGSVLARVRHIFKDNPKVYFAKSMTTRSRRGGNEDEFYDFRTTHEFWRALVDKRLLEFTYRGGAFYGTPIDELQGNCTTILELDVAGNRQLEEKVGADRMISVFLVTSTAAELERRLRGRGTEDEKEILERLTLAVGEVDHLSGYDYIIVNDVLDKTVEKVRDLIEGKPIQSDSFDAATFKKELLQVIERLKEEMEKGGGRNE